MKIKINAEVLLIKVLFRFYGKSINKILFTTCDVQRYHLKPEEFKMLAKFVSIIYFVIRKIRFFIMLKHMSLRLYVSNIYFCKQAFDNTLCIV